MNAGAKSSGRSTTESAANRAALAPASQAYVKRQRHGLSFVTETTTKRGRFITLNCFDVPPERWSHGYVRGIRVAQELLVKMRSDRGVWMLSKVAHDAYLAADEEEVAGKSRRGASFGFTSVIAKLAAASARSPSFDNWINAEIENALCTVRREQENFDRAAARMRAGKSQTRVRRTSEPAEVQHA